MSVPPSLEERIRGLEDHAEIRGLTYRYCDLIWRTEGAQVGDLFTEDGIFVPDGKPDGERTLRGRAAIAKFYDSIPARNLNNLPHPFIHNHVITITGDTARGNCSIDNRHGDCSTMSVGYYDDEFQRTPEGWKFSRRIHHPLFKFTFALKP